MSIKNYSVYSTIGGMLSFQDIINSDFTKRTKKAVLTDLNSLFGVPAFIDECNKNDVEPIIGCTLRIKENDQYLGTITVYAKNENGFNNLKKIVSDLDKDSFKDESISFDSILKNKDDLIVTNGGFDSIIYNHLKKEDKESSSRFIYQLKSIFKDDFFFEIQENDQPMTKRINNYIASIGNRNNIKVLFSQNNRFKKDGLYNLFIEKMKVIKGVDNKTNSELKDHYLQSDKILTDLELNEKQRPYKNFITSTNDFLNKFTGFNIFYDIPEIPVSPGYTDKNSFFDEIQSAYSLFIKDIEPTKRPLYDKRLKEELDLIKELKFENYFILFMNIAKNKKENQRFNLRGSAVSFLISNVLKLSDIDPVANELLCERFLNKNRLVRHELPDLDLESNDIESIAKFLKDTFGSENSAYLSSTSGLKSGSQLSLTIKAIEANIKDTPLNNDGTDRLFPKESINILRSFIDSVWNGNNKTFTELLSPSYWISKKDFKYNFRIKEDISSKEFNNKYYKMNNLVTLCKNYPEIKLIVGFCLQTKDIITNTNPSYGSLVVSNEPISNFFSTTKNLKHDAVLDLAITSNKAYTEKLGLVKLDILSNVYLNSLQNAFNKINLDWDFEDKNNPYSDQAVFDMIGKGYTETINQLKAPKQRELTAKLNVSNFEELTAAIALLRPGVGAENIQKYIDNKNNPEHIKSIKNPEMQTILRSTHGVLIFEEQLMLIAQKIGNLTKEESDDFRSLLKKSNGAKEQNKPDLASKILFMKNKFKSNAIEQNKLTEQDVNDIMTQIEAVEGGYTFSKAHSLSYSSLVYRQGFVDVNFPGEYLQSFIIDKNISSARNITEIERDRKAKLKAKNKGKKDTKEKENEFDLYIDKCERMGRKFLGLSINRSVADFKTIKDNNNNIFIDPSLQFILKDEKMTNTILKVRSNRKFDNLYDFIERTLPIYTGKTVFDTFWLDDNNINNQRLYKMNVIKLIQTGGFDKLIPEKAKSNIAVGRTILINSVDDAIELTLNPYSQEDFIYTNPKNSFSLDEFCKAEKDIIGYSPLEFKIKNTYDQKKIVENNVKKTPIKKNKI